MRLQRLRQTTDFYINSDAYLMHLTEHGVFYTEKLKCTSTFDFFFTTLSNRQYLFVNGISKQLGNTLQVYSLETKEKRACSLGTFILVEVLFVLPDKEGFLGLFDDIQSNRMFYCLIRDYDLFSMTKKNSHLVDKIKTAERVLYEDTTRGDVLEKFQR